MATSEQQVASPTAELASKKKTAPGPLPRSVSIAKSGFELTSTEDEKLLRIAQLGLGRGVDATEPSPWSKKSPFQVRYITSDSIIATDEGGTLQTYEREIASLTTVQTDLKASVSVPAQAPVDLNLEGEFSRSVSSNRKAVGKQIINRTVSFRADFNEIPQGAPTDSYDMNTGSVIRDLYKSGATPGPVPLAHYTFEQRLAEWIMERVVQRQESEDNYANGDDIDAEQMPNIEGVEPIKDLANFLKTACKKARECVYEDCISFVRHFRVTHYVNAIQLGASHYRVLSENEYYKKVNASGTFGYDAVAKLLSSATYTKKTTFKASETRQIGEIIDDKVERGSNNEAVVGIKIQPIHSLVKLRYLHLALQRALEVYIEEQRDTTSGPYLIACGAKSNIFWKVKFDEEQHTYSIDATTNLKEAALFYILPDDDGKRAYEFKIGWKNTESKERQIKRTKSILHPDTVRGIEPLYRYLDTNVNISGRNPGPLYLKSEIHQAHCRLTLHSRLIGGNKAPIDTKVWGSGKEQFFINCARRRFKVDGYIAVKQVSGRRGTRRSLEEKYTTVCVPKETCHNERDTWMLFRLLPAQLILTDREDVKVERKALKPTVPATVPEKQEVGGGRGVVRTASDSDSRVSNSKHEDIEMRELLPRDQDK